MRTIWKSNIITAALIVAVLFVSVFISVGLFLSMDFRVYDNEIRIRVSEQLNKIEKDVYEKGEYPYIVLDLDGKVLYSEPPFENKTGDIVNTQEMLQFDRSFSHSYKNTVKESFILRKSGKTSGFAIFLIPENEIITDSRYIKAVKLFLPAFSGILICAVLIIFRSIYLNKRILRPLKEICTSAQGIIAGNYDLEVVRIYGKTTDHNEVGDLTYSFELMRDELKMKQIREEILKKSQQELISCISHDLKTPISTIKAYSEGIRDGLAKTPELQQEYIRIIINKTDLLTEMIRELLKFSNAQLNQLDITRREVYFSEYFYSVIKELGIYVKKNGIDFSYEYKTPDMIVAIDTKRITEVLYNLVENSIKYIGEKQGRIIIEAERQGEFVLIKVRDNGIGISPDDIPYVFDKFYRAEKSRSSRIPGSGLGLSICKYIVNEHGGEIYCKSRHLQGCEIGFTIK